MKGEMKKQARSTSWDQRILFDELNDPKYDKFEPNISSKKEADLHRAIVFCEKNPDHSHFIPYKDFALSKLPEHFQDPDICECVQKIGQLTVKVCVNACSEKRPIFFRNECHQSGGHLTGSGGAFIPKRRRRGRRCVCTVCQDSKKPSPVWCFVWISTARHVVFDDFEASHTEILLNYDDDENKASIKRLQGHRLVNVDDDADRCILECITHDISVHRAIKSARGRVKHLETKLCSKYAAHVVSSGVPPLAIIVSHPHGCNKQVSIGAVLQKTTVKSKDACSDIESTRYVYNTPTCKGSSGALVWLLGQTRVGYRDRHITTHTHSARETQVTNVSGWGLDFSQKTQPDSPLSHLISNSTLSSSNGMSFISQFFLMFCFFCVLLIWF